MYIKSDKIKVFPAAGRGDDYPEGFLTTEDNLSNLIRSLYTRNNSGFVISSNPLKFVLRGYAFEIEDTSSLDLTADLYATIYLRDDLETGSYKRLIPPEGSVDVLDTDSGFAGATFTTTESDIPSAPTGSTAYTLQLLSAGEIPLTSKFAYSTDELIYLNGETPETLTDALEKCVEEISAETKDTDTGRTLVINFTKYPK